MTDKLESLDYLARMEVTAKDQNRCEFVDLKAGQLDLWSVLWRKRDPDVVDLIQRLLVCALEKRMSLKNALKHGYFEDKQSHDGE